MNPCSCGHIGQIADLAHRQTVSTKASERGKPGKACPVCQAPRCAVCGNPVALNRSYCGSSCKQKYFSQGSRNVFYGKRFVGEENPFYGRKHSETTRYKMSMAHTPERRKKASELLQTMWDSEAFRASAATTTNGKFGWHQSLKAGMIYHRSSWELIAYLYLDEDKDVKTYSTESISIPYEFEGKSKLYYPDIIVEYMDGSKEIIEMKPNYRLDEKKTKAKLEAAQSWSEKTGIAFSVWTGDRELRLPQDARV